MFLRLISELACNKIIRTLLLESVEVEFSEFSLEMPCENDNEIVQFFAFDTCNCSHILCNMSFVRDM